MSGALKPSQIQLFIVCALAPLVQNLLLIPLHLLQPSFANGNVFAFAVVIPYGAEGERTGFFLQREPGCVVFFRFGGADGGRFEQREEEGAEQVARADDPRGDAVDARVEIVEYKADAAALLNRSLATPLTGGDDFASDGLEFVGEGDDVVAVPADAAADVQQNLRQEL